MPEIIAGTYELLQKIGSGGSGTVYLANHLRLGKKVILKADKRKITARPELLRREVDVLKNLHHAYIPQVYDYFVEGDTVYTVMDYIEGESLDKPLKRGEKFPQAQVIKWACQLLEALVYLHSPTHGDPPRGYTHSDIKPANLMRTPQNDVILIDFNIALALGEENVIGRSAGYASPEHYGLDYSTGPSGIPGPTELVVSPTATTVLVDENETGTGSRSSTRSTYVVTPDVRSDIYSVGATLYHLLCGRRPAGNAKEVVPLSPQEFSPQLVAIITRAMTPNPDLRYQTADEMLYAFKHLWQNDPRTRRQKWARHIACAVCGSLLAVGTVLAFVGLRRMQTQENWLRLAQDSVAALQAGDREGAITAALQALPAGSSPLRPPLTAEAQRALANALGIYDLADGYKAQAVVTLPSAPLAVALAPDGKTAACQYAGNVALADAATGTVFATLPTDPSALCEVEFLESDTLLYAGVDGLQAYSISAAQTLWKGAPATGIAVSADGGCVAAVYRDETRATVYDTADGQQLASVDFGGRHQQVAFNDIYANPNDDILALNADGTLLAASFADGSLELFDLRDPDGGAVIYDAGSGYDHFEGGFYQNYFAFSAAGTAEPVFAVIDTNVMEQTGSLDYATALGVRTDSTGIYLHADNILVRIDPATGAQTPLVTTPLTIRGFARDEGHTLIVTNEGIEFYDVNANRVAAYEQTYPASAVALAGEMALMGNREEPVVRILRYENYPETEVFTYDPTLYAHDETRLSADGKQVMQFSINGFRIYDIGGTLVAEAELPNSGQIYDQQFQRQGSDSWLEATWYDGTVRSYSAADGELLSEETGPPPDTGLYEEFFVKGKRVSSPLHGTPTVYDEESGRQVATLDEDAYLTYVTEAGDCIVAQYTTTDGYNYGQLLNGDWQVVADLPYLCDVIDDTLYFDYPTGNMRQARIYDINTLRTDAQNRLNGGTIG